MEGDFKREKVKKVLYFWHDMEFPPAFVPMHFINRETIEYFYSLEELVDMGYLARQMTSDHVLYNYTDKATFDKHWNHFTLENRGTVYNRHTGMIAARPFPKFFNFGELPGDKQKKILDEQYGKYVVNEKLDGSLGIIWYNDRKAEWVVSTRGSFSSEQAIMGTEMLNKFYTMSLVPKNVTLLAEIIYPSNKIVVNYGLDRKLALLAIFNTFSGEEYSQSMANRIQDLTGMSRSTEYGLKIVDIISLLANLTKDEEGYVVRFENGERVKFKSHEYMRVAKILAHCTPLSFWECMDKNGKVSASMLEAVPEEFMPEIKPVVAELERRYAQVLNETHEDLLLVHKSITMSVEEYSLRAFKRLVGLALKKKELTLKHPIAIYNTLDGKGNHEYIMDRIRPKGNIL